MNFFPMMLQVTTPNGTGGPAPWMQFLPWVAIFVVFYFFMIRPQSVKAKEERKFRDNLQKGDHVVTIGGLHGKITETSSEWVILESESQVRFKVERSAISKDTTLHAYPPTSK